MYAIIIVIIGMYLHIIIRVINQSVHVSKGVLISLVDISKHRMEGWMDGYLMIFNVNVKKIDGKSVVGRGVSRYKDSILSYAARVIHNSVYSETPQHQSCPKARSRYVHQTARTSH